LEGVEGDGAVTERTVKDADKPFIGNDGHQRFKESVDTSRTPEEERADPDRGKAARPDGTVK